MAEDKDDTVYCDIQMPVEQGRKLLPLVKALHDSGSHPSLEQVIIDMKRELTDSIDIVDNPLAGDSGSTASSAWPTSGFPLRT